VRQALRGLRNLGILGFRDWIELGDIQIFSFCDEKRMLEAKRIRNWEFVECGIRNAASGLSEL
jgi:hypothetical protein